MGKISNPEVAAVYKSLAPVKRKKLLALRGLIFDVAGDATEIGAVEESLKWGEPSYTAVKGSAVRIAWRSKTPDSYALYFNCQTSLVETFRELYSEQLRFEGKRAIVFLDDDVVPVEAVKHCVLLALDYHRRKKQPMLGA